MDARGLDAFVTFNLKNVRYLTGYTGTNGAALITGDGAIFFTDFRYATQAREEVKSMKRRIIAKSLPEEVGREIKAAKARRVGFEDRHMTVNLLTQLRKQARARWEPCGIVEELRIVKDETEIALIEKNFGFLEKTFSSIGEIVAAGRRESEAAAELEYRLRLLGGEKAAFDFIISSGTRSALPHGVAGNKRMKKGEPVIVDWGWVLEGYHTDNTRTLFLGKPKPKLKGIFEIVLEANRRSIAKVAPGVALADIDAAGRSLIESRGYGKYFGHGTGHGVGLDIHEAPNVNPRSKDTAREGMVFTIEPGIYLPGIGGVRIEDMVVVTAKGCRVISRKIPKELREIL